jgi:hypothetical protein
VAIIGKQVPHRAFRPIRNDIGFVFSHGFLVLVSQARSRAPAFALCAVMETPCQASGIANGCRDLSTAVVLRVREAQPPLKMTELDRNDPIRFGLAAESRRHVKISKHTGPEDLPRLRLWKRLARLP